MTTHRAIVDALLESAAQRQSVVLATVVRISGSSYGGVGTRMVARVDGSTVGIVSGGCLESDLAEHAKEVHAKRQPRFVTYDTRADDETAWGLGLGCNGLIDVLLEPLSPGEAAAVGRLLETALAAPQNVVVGTVIASAGDGAPAVGAHALFAGETIETTGDWGDRSVLSRAAEDSSEALAAGRRGMVKEYDATAIAFETVKPAIRLVVLGGGPEVQPVARFGAELGWDVTVVDHRPVSEEHSSRFPGASVIHSSEPARVSDDVHVTLRTAAVVMSHHYARDLAYLRSFLATDAVYIGVLGPNERLQRMLRELSDAERDAAGARLYAPVGLDVGGEGSEGIALSIIAEVSAVMEARKGGHLRERRAPLH